jgi:hypothetical protein
MIPIECDTVVPAWHYGSKGIFSIKLAYKLTIQICDQWRGNDASSSTMENP